MGRRIAHVEAIPFAVPMREPASISWFATIERRDGVFVRLVTDDGQEGVGDAVTAPYFTGETARGAADMVTQFLAPAIVGMEPLSLSEIGSRLLRIAPRAPAARAAVDIALHDLAARTLDVPVHDLLGGIVHDSLSASMHLFSPDVAVISEQAARAAEEGFSILKVKVGRLPWAQELERLAAIRRAAGVEVRIYVDANQAWRPREARAFAEGAVPLGVELLEQPVVKSDLRGMAAVAEVPGIAVGPDEGVFDAADAFAHAREHAADVIVVKLSKCGGFGGIRDVMAVAAAAGIDVYVAGMPGETSISTAAGIHLAVATPALPFGVGVGAHYISHDLVKHPISPSGGLFTPPSGPGLGVEVDDAALAEFRLPD